MGRTEGHKPVSGQSSGADNVTPDSRTRLPQGCVVQLSPKPLFSKPIFCKYCYNVWCSFSHLIQSVDSVKRGLEGLLKKLPEFHCILQEFIRNDEEKTLKCLRPRDCGVDLSLCEEPPQRNPSQLGLAARSAFLACSLSAAVASFSFALVAETAARFSLAAWLERSFGNV